MANFPALKMTAAGRELQLKAQAGQPLKFTRVAMGDAGVPVDSDTLTALVSEQLSLAIQSQTAPGDGTAVLRVIMTNQLVTSGFFMRELGAFAEDPDTGEELLYSYSNAGPQADYLPAAGGTVVWEGIFDLVTVVGNAENVTAVINDYITIALKSDVEALRPYLLPEGGTVGQMVRRRSNTVGDNEWFDPTDGLDIRISSVEEPRTAVNNQRVFTLQKTVTNGLAVYITGSRLSRELWTSLSSTQLQLDDPLPAGTKVLFVNNEEAGPGRALNVSINGPVLVYPGTVNEYTITDFDSFSVYQASSTVGTLTRNGAAITLDIPAGQAAGTLDLEILRDNVRATYRVAIGDAAIAAPELLSPVSGSMTVAFEPDLGATDFVVYPASYDVHTETRWQIARDELFADLVLDHQDAANLAAISLAALGVRLTHSTRYYARVRYVGASLQSPWSAVVPFNTASTYVRAPAITSPTDGQVQLSPTPTLAGDAFSVYGGADTHESSRWQVATDAAFSAVIVDSGWSAANKLNVKPTLTKATSYYARVMYRGDALGDSEWSAVVRFTTADRLRGEYTQRNGGATPRSSHSAVVIGGQMYVFGGSDSAGYMNYSFRNDLWRYDPATNIWAQRASGATARSGHCAAVCNGLMYVFGGAEIDAGSGSGLRNTSTLYRYDPVANSWAQLAVGPAWSGSAGTLVEVAGKLYAFMAWGSGIGVYDPATNSWSTRSVPANALGRSHSAVVINGKIIYFGGYNGSVYNNNVYMYDPALDTWTLKASGASKRSQHSAVAIDGKMYVYGGFRESGGAANDLWMYDPVSNVWAQLASGATARSSHSAVAVGDRVYLFGGGPGGYSYINDLWQVE